MSHIHTAPGQHDHTVSIYLFRTDFDEPRLMLHFHAKIKAYAQFGGHVELSETPWQAALHELREETGYDMKQLKILQPAQRLRHITGAIIHPQPAVHATMGDPSYGGHHHTDSVYVFTTTETPHHLPMEGESTDIQLLTRAEVAQRADIDTITRDVALYVFDELLNSWKPIDTKEFK